MKNIFWFLVLAVVAGGCVIAPTASTVKPGMISDFKTTQTITIQNVAENGAYKRWTNPLVKSLSRELALKGAAITGNASTILKVKITNVKQDSFYSLLNNKCSFDVEVQAGTGYTANFSLSDVSWSMQKSANALIRKAVVEILNDKEIVEYLRGKESVVKEQMDALDNNNTR
jgi:phage host-nuclease inhibitor protein Gam